MNDVQFLYWIYTRMTGALGESEDTDYMIRFKQIIDAQHEGGEE